MPRLVSLAALLTAAAVGRAEPPPAVGRLPKTVGFVIAVRDPAKLVRTATDLPAVQGFRGLPAVADGYDTPGVKRFLELVEHLTAKTGYDRFALLDKLAGRGIAVGLELGSDPAPAVVVLEGTDAAVTADVYDTLAAAAAADPATKLVRRTHAGFATLAAGPEAHTARVGATVYFANTEKMLHAALDLRKSGDAAAAVTAHSSLVAAEKLAGPTAAAWAWLDLDRLKQSQAAKDFFENSKKEFVQTVVAGGTIDAVRRAGFLVAALDVSPGGIEFSVKMPAKRADLDPALALHAPPAGTAGMLPPLGPPGAIVSQSFYLDFAGFWKNRKQTMSDESRAELEKTEKEVSRFLPGRGLSGVLELSGPYHRLCVMNTGENLYPNAPKPAVVYPPAVYVSQGKPGFGKAVEPLLRGGALAAAFQLGWKMTEETVGTAKLTTYRFPEKPNPSLGDTEDVRFNFAPTFTIADDTMIVGSTPGAVKAVLAEALTRETFGRPRAPVWHVSANPAAAADAVRANPDPFVRDALLDRGLSLAAAKKEVAAYARWLATLGPAELSIDHGTNAFTFTARWAAK